MEITDPEAQERLRDMSYLMHQIHSAKVMGLSHKSMSDQVINDDIPWLLDLLGHPVKPVNAEGLCSCEYIDVGVGGPGIRVPNNPNCIEHFELFENVYFGGDETGTAVVESLLHDVENVALREEYKDADLRGLVLSLAYRLRRNLIPYPGENIEREYGLEMSDEEGNKSYLPMESLKACMYVSDNTESVKIVSRFKRSSHSEWEHLAETYAPEEHEKL